MRRSTTFVLALAVPALVASLAHCSSTSNASGDGTDGGNSAFCPSSPPGSGAPCSAETTTCNYAGGGAPGCYCCGGGGGRTFVCSNGHWAEEATAAPGTGVGCPATVPADGTSCSPGCGGALLTCSFDCARGNGYNSSATCEQDGTWHVAVSATPCASDAGAGDDASDAAADARDGS